MKKFFFGVFNAAIVIMPMILMGAGIWLGTGAVWDALFVLSMIAFGLYAWSKYQSVKTGQDWQGTARQMVALFGSLGAFILLVVQLLYAAFAKDPVCPIPAEAAVVWMFILMIILGVTEVRRNRPDNGFLTCGLYLAYIWIGLCCFAGCCDIIEYFTAFRMPERIMDVLGAIAGITAITAVVSLIIGIIKEHFH